MATMKPLILLCIIGSLLASGCASVRVTTDLKPESDPTLKSSAGQFYVAGLKYGLDVPGSKQVEEVLWIGGSAGTQRPLSIDEDYGRRLLSAVRRECMASYPLMFARNDANAIRVSIEVSDTLTPHNGKMAAWALCTAFLAGTVFPVPFQTDHDIEIAVGCWNGRGNLNNGAVRENFRREDHGWFSILSPLGLITVPGESDFSKVRTGPNNQRAGYDDVPQIARQIATAVAKLIAAQDPAFWTAPILAPGVPDAVQALPAALPVPKEFATPF